ncbi:hypothetical protein [Naasia aerilata]|uniref:hypothetical protein n=1 Tax=Naasia aerilata TaxID=1162966 RepID=UPI00257262F1|nr:hypothetical protein [Naasia aerilata]
MGTNKRYGSDLSRAAINEAAVRPKPISLTQQEAGDEVRAAREPVEVTAWVRFPESPIEVEARAIAWTERAVLVEFRMHSGATHQAWVWASAVRRR